MTEPTADPHRRRLDAIASNAIGPALNTAPTPETGERWWFSLSLREHVGRAVVQALVDAGAIPPPPADLDAPRHTASDITDDQLDALYGEIDGLSADLMDERRHNDATCEAVQERDAYRRLLAEVVDLADVTHKYGSMGGHDCLGRDLTCKGCQLHQRIRDMLAARSEPAADTDTAPHTDHRPQEQA